MVELLGAVSAIDVHSEQLRGKYVTLLVDSEPIEGCLVKGYSSQEDAGDLASVFWDLVRRFDIAVYISRISTDANPADERGPVCAETLAWAVLAWRLEQICGCEPRR